MQGLDCPTCGCQLVPETLPADSLVATRPKLNSPMEFVELCRPRIYPMALLIQQTLEQHGIVVYIHGGNAIALMPHLAFGGELRVLVLKEQLDHALELYKAYFDSDEGIDYILEAES